MKHLTFCVALFLFSACNNADTPENDNINDNASTPATIDSIPNNPSPHSPRTIPVDSSPSTMDSAKLHQ